MRPTEQSPTWRYLVVGAIALVAGFATWLNWLSEQHLSYLASVHFNQPVVETPFQRVRPGFTADASMWIRYATDTLEGKRTLRSHYTTVDNAPTGREMHWNSGLLAWTAACGWVTHKVTGWPIPTAVERAAVWGNLPLLVLFMAGFAWWTYRRAGAWPAVAVAFCALGQRWFYEGFMPSYADHHGLVSAGVAGLLLGVLFMGAGWVRPADGPATLESTCLPTDEDSALRAARWSGFWGGFGMWISTASLVFPIVVLSVGVLFATLACRDQLLAGGARFVGRIWRTWGRAGALTSFAFYLLEYFPFQLGWRMEVNHPLYALAWWAGAEFLAELLEWIAAPAERRAEVARSVLGAALWVGPVLLLPALLILFRGPAVFTLADSFMARLHNSIGEFLPMAQRISGRSVSDFIEIVGWKLLAPLLGTVLVVIFRRRAPFQLLLAVFMSTALLMLGMFWQARWGTLGASAEMPLIIATLAVIFALPRSGSTGLRRGLVAGVIIVLFYGVSIFQMIAGQSRATRTHLIQPDHVLELVNRDIAGVLRRSQPEGDIVLFTNPNASVSVGYYGRFQTMGTLYWENLTGLRAAAELVCARNDDEAMRIIKRLGITHIAVISEENFVVGYAQLFEPGITLEALKSRFGARLLARNIPVWLEPLLYTAPRGLQGNLATLEVDLYKVNFKQSTAQAYLNAANLYASRNNFAAAIELATQSATNAPLDPLPYKFIATLQLRQKQWDAALRNLEKSIERLPADQQTAGWTEAAIALTAEKQYAASVRFYQQAISLNAANTIALNNLTWRLAVAADDRLRDPATALNLARRLNTQITGNATATDTLATALAANGKFEEAVAKLREAIALAEREDNQPLLAALRQRLALFESRQPWRE